MLARLVGVDGVTEVLILDLKRGLPRGFGHDATDRMETSRQHDDSIASSRAVQSFIADDLDPVDIQARAIIRTKVELVRAFAVDGEKGSGTAQTQGVSTSLTHMLVSLTYSATK